MNDELKTNERPSSVSRVVVFCTITVVFGLTCFGALCWGWAYIYSTNMVKAYNTGVAEGKRVTRREVVMAIETACAKLELEIKQKQEQKGAEVFNEALEKRLDKISTTTPSEFVRVWYKVAATREGLVGEKTASGHVIKETDVFVALPSRKALGKLVEVRYAGKSIQCKVEDVGPWSTQDDYWNTTRARPLSEEGKRVPVSMLTKYGPTKNKAGIDLSNGLWDLLGIPRGKGIAPVEWRFVE